MSASGKKDAAVFASFASTATPSDMLAERKTGTFSEQAFIRASSSSEYPVVAITTGILRLAAYSVSCAAAKWLEKSIMQSAGPS